MYLCLELDAMALVIHPTLPSLVHLPSLCLREIKCEIFAVVQFDCMIVLADFEQNENVTLQMSQENQLS